MRYETTTFEPSSRLGLRGVSRFSVAEDDIRVVPGDDGTHIRWTLTVSFRGGAKLLKPVMTRLMRPALERLGVEAMTGLAKALDGRLLSA